MKKLFILLCIAFASQVFMACTKDDNPVDTGKPTNITDPQEVVSDQPAYAPSMPTE